MPRHRFYEIPVGAYLFRPPSPEPKAKTSPEEQVRQWCAFELIRHYGLFVSDLEFERPVKVGSKTYRIDVLVNRNGFPWIVVECKEANFKKHADAMAQAISYADARDIQAEFAVYTNGGEWHVKRKVQRDWVEVPDLPTRSIEPSGPMLGEILDALHEAAPLLHKLDEPLSDKDAECFLGAMQTFFHGHNMLTAEVDAYLCTATDHLLRVLSVRNADLSYQWDKLHTAWRNWEAYRKRAGSTSVIHEVDTGGRIDAACSSLHYSLENLVREAPTPRSCDALVLRLDVALLDYAKKVFHKGNQFLPIGHLVHHALRDFLNYAFKTELDTQLPDPVDTGSMEQVKSFGSGGWEDLYKGCGRS